MRYVEDYPVGFKEEIDAEYAVTEDEILEFGRRWDPQPFHVNPEAAKDSYFGGLVASSVHLFAIATGLGTKTPVEKRPASVSALGFNNMQVKSPARPGDILKLRIEVTDSRQSNSKPDLGIIGIYHEMVNQGGEIVFTFEDAFLIKRKI
jgi:acyl dehydratase